MDPEREQEAKRMLGDRWGVTAQETARVYPCDALVPRPVLSAWRGVTVQAPRDHVWRWLVQLRLAPYSYDWIDNLGRRSPQELRDLPDPVVGGRFMSVLGGRACGRIQSVTVGEQLTGTIAGATISYVLVGAGDAVSAGDPAQTRLLMKIVMASGRAIAPLVALGDLVMARRQLLNLAQLAERTVPV